MVRAHVRARAGQVTEGASYLQAALDYLAEDEAVVVAIGGFPGSGKSTMARRLAPGLGRAPGALVIRADEVRKHRAHVPPEQRLPAEAYSEVANQAVNAAVLDSVILAASGGQAVIADTTFLDPAQRAAIEAGCAAAGLAFRGMWLDVPMQTLRARVRARTGDASDATEAVLLRAAARGVGELHWTRVANP
jgi:predicted kinase